MARADEQTTANTNLLRLFPPAKRTRPIFALLTSAMAHPQETLPFELALAALRGFWRWALARRAARAPRLRRHVRRDRARGRRLEDAAAPRPAPLRDRPHGSRRARGAGVGFSAAHARGAEGDALRDLHRLLARRRSRRPAGDDDGKPLTPWLADLIDRAAAARDFDAPLTFGDLWGADPQQPDVVAPDVHDLPDARPPLPRPVRGERALPLQAVASGSGSSRSGSSTRSRRAPTGAPTRTRRSRSRPRRSCPSSSRARL